MERSVATARAYRQAHGPAILRAFAELTSIPNVAADPAGLQCTAAWFRDQLDSRGFAAATTAIPGVPPVVMATIPGRPGGPRLGVYIHYDGQPVDPDAWDTPPFEPTLRAGKDGPIIPFPADGDDIDPEWRIHGRATADDRAPLIALLAALDALDGATPEATIVVLAEGEEEIGSVHLPDYFRLLSDRLRADAWLVCDGPVHQSGRPQIAFGVRGICEVEIEVFGPPGDLHSGHYGDWAPNPAVSLARLIATMRDDDGRATIPGFSGEAARPDEAAIAAAADVPEPPAMGFPPPEGGGYARRVLDPLLNVRGLRSGDVGDASRNVVPASATASIDLRLVAGQDADAAVGAIRAHAVDQGFHLVEGEPDDATRAQHRKIARIVSVPGYRGVRTSPGHPAVARVREAVECAGGQEAVLLPSYGGSVPLDHFEILGAPLAILPIANYDNNQHAANENLRVGNLWYGIDVYAALMGRAD